MITDIANNTPNHMRVFLLKENCFFVLAIFFITNLFLSYKYMRVACSVFFNKAFRNLTSAIVFNNAFCRLTFEWQCNRYYVVKAEQNANLLPISKLLQMRL